MSSFIDLSGSTPEMSNFLLFYKAACCFYYPRSPCCEHDYGIFSDTLPG